MDLPPNPTASSWAEISFPPLHYRRLKFPANFLPSIRPNYSLPTFDFSKPPILIQPSPKSFLTIRDKRRQQWIVALERKRWGVCPGMDWSKERLKRKKMKKAEGRSIPNPTHRGPLPENTDFVFAFIQLDREMKEKRNNGWYYQVVFYLLKNNPEHNQNDKQRKNNFTIRNWVSRRR